MNIKIIIWMAKNTMAVQNFNCLSVRVAFIKKWNTIWYATISFEKNRVAVVQQFYETRVIDEFVLRGNTATLKCLVPSFVADFVDVIEWQDEDGSIYTVNSQQEKGTYIDCTKLILTKWRNNYKFLSHILFLNPIIL